MFDLLTDDDLFAQGREIPDKSQWVAVASQAPDLAASVRLGVG
jgi:hypothetical protein